jgi:hypothetical protein
MSPSMNNDDLAVLDQAFRSVCVELGLGANADDNERRERLSQIIMGIANDGERDLTAIARRALEQMKVNELA